MRLITRLWSQQKGDFFCISTKNSRGEWGDHFFSKQQIEGDAVENFIADHHECDLYFCPTGFNARRRLRSAVVLPNLLWADLDEADPRDFKERLKPTIAIESSPGRYVGLWVTDRIHDTNVNRALSYFVGADKGGWDLTQVLRVPGTINYKYTALPRVRTLWTDGQTHRMADIIKDIGYVPDEKRDEGSDDVEAARIYRKWERKIPHWARRALMGRERVIKGKRSEMMWKLSNTLIEKGISSEDCFFLLKASPWNKFEGRDSQLRRELDKIIKNRMKEGLRSNGKLDDKEPDRDSDYVWLARTMDEVEEEDIDWIWYPYLARGELSILEGDPGLGKSYLAQMVAGSICDGLCLPDAKEGTGYIGDAATEGIKDAINEGGGRLRGLRHRNNGLLVGGGVQGKVVYFDMENSAGSVTLKRLRGNGFKQLHNYTQEEAVFSIDDEDKMDAVLEALERVKPVLVVFDTLNTYLGKADAFKGHEAQQAFGRFREMAKRFQCSVLVLRHLTKSSKERALYRGQGSIAFAGLARVVMTVGVLPDEPDVRAMAVTKLNVAAKPPAITFTIEGRPDTQRERDRSAFCWGEFVDISSENILSPIEGNGDGESERAEIMDKLTEWLSTGAGSAAGVEVSRIETYAEAHSISKNALRRAAREMGIVRKYDVKGGADGSAVWRWSLPVVRDDGTPKTERGSIKKVTIVNAKKSLNGGANRRH